MKTVQVKRAGWRQAMMVLLVVVLVAGCAPSTPDPVAAWKPSTPQPEVTLPAETQTVSTSSAPSVTPTLTVAPSVTPTSEPTATATATIEPTETPVPTLGVEPDGFSVWCNPTKYDGSPVTVQAPKYANVLFEEKGTAQVRIPATFCVAAYIFNQSLPEGAQLWMYDNTRAFLKVKLTPDAENPQIGYVAIKHPYVVNPPYWEITYRLALVLADGKEMRSDTVEFARPLPSKCPFGGLPDPITMKCAATTDPWEVEPHPGVKYPYPTHTPNP